MKYLLEINQCHVLTSTSKLLYNALKTTTSGCCCQNLYRSVCMSLLVCKCSWKCKVMCVVCMQGMLLHQPGQEACACDNCDFQLLKEQRPIKCPQTLTEFFFSLLLPYQ